MLPYLPTSMLKSQSCRKTRQCSKKVFPRLSPISKGRRLPFPEPHGPQPPQVQQRRQHLLLETDIKSLRESLKTQKAEIKQTEKEIAKLEAKKAAVEAKAAEAAKKVEAEAVLKKLLASGMTADDILEKLK